MSAPVTFHRGAAISLALDVVSGDPGAVTLASANMQRTISGQLIGAEIAIAMDFASAAGAEPARWLVSLADTSALEPGNYQVDAVLVSGSRIKPEPLIIRIAAA